MEIKKGAVDQTIYVEILDSTSTSGGRKTGLVFNSAGLVASYVRTRGARVAITLATLASASAAHSDGGFIEVDATNMPGIYRLDLPDAAVATGADEVVVTLKGATGMAQVSRTLELVTNIASDIIADTDDIQARLPAALVSGRMDASVGAMAANVLTATAIATGAFTAAKFAAGAFDAVWTVAARLLTAGTNIVLAKGTGITGFNDPTVGAIADAVWDEPIAGHVGVGSTGEALTAAGSAGDPWATALPGAYGAGSAGFIVGNNVDAAISSRASQTSVDSIPTNAELATALAAADDATLAAIAALNDISPAEVNAEVVDALNVDTYAEPGQGAPAATTSLAAKLNYLYKAWRNKRTQTGTTHSLFDDAGSTVDQKSTTSDDGTTATRGEMVSGP